MIRVGQPVMVVVDQEFIFFLLGHARAPCLFCFVPPSLKCSGAIGSGAVGIGRVVAAVLSPRDCVDRVSDRLIPK